MPNRGSNFSNLKSAFAVLLFCAATAIASFGQTFTTLFSFDGSNGSGPTSPLVQGFDGNLYGTTYGDGVLTFGTVFKITPGGTLTTLYVFGADGTRPLAGLTLASDGIFYGTTLFGGDNTKGTIFKITSRGQLTTLYSFCAQGNCDDGSFPPAGVVQATDGNFYGVTCCGGANDKGTVFKITPGGQLTTLHSFAGPEGAQPSGGLAQGTDGNFYGTAAYGGGVQNDGTVFKITPGGTLTTLQKFRGIRGTHPVAPLVQASDGSFYGTTSEGGASGRGTIFKITPGGALTTLHSFHQRDGARPDARLTQAIDGNLYGTTVFGGAHDSGTIFRITPEGTLTTLHSFAVTDGAFPDAGLVEATDGMLYGTTEAGGTGTQCAGGCGTVFSLDVGLGAFVEALPAFGKVGAKVIILGTNLTGTTDVSFNGTTATFNVVSSSEIKTTVPTGATTGNVTVTTPGGTLSSNLVFRVKP
jgi:uncharacterized repeat protein (TIGR03803 family)